MKKITQIQLYFSRVMNKYTFEIEYIENNKLKYFLSDSYDEYFTCLNELSREVIQFKIDYIRELGE